MSQRDFPTLLHSILPQLDSYNEEKFLKCITSLELPTDLHAEVEQQLSEDRVAVLPWRKDSSSWVNLQQRLTCAAKRGDLKAVDGLLAQLEEAHRQVTGMAKDVTVPPLPSLTVEALWMAANHGRTAVIELFHAHGLILLMSEGPSQQPDILLFKALFVAAEGGRLETFQLLSSYGNADPNLLIHAAASGNNLEIFRWLLARILERNLRMGGPLLIQEAARNNNREMVQLLLDNAPEASSRIIKGVEPLEELKDQALCGAAKGGHLELAQWLVSIGATDLDQALLRSINPEGLKVARWLISIGAQEPTPYDIDEDMQYATQRPGEAGDMESIKWLVKIGCDPDPGFLAAAAHGHLEIAQELVNSGDVEMNDEALKNAARGGHLELVRWIPIDRLRPEEQVDCLRNAMDAAAGEGHLEVVEELLQRINQQEISTVGSEHCLGSALTAAAGGGHLAMIEWLISRGATASVKTLVTAAANGQLEAVRKLLEGPPLTDDPPMVSVTQTDVANALTAFKNAKDTWWRKGLAIADAATELPTLIPRVPHLGLIRGLTSNTANAPTKALIAAAEGGHLKVVEQLVDNDLKEAITAAIENGQLEVALYLLEREAASTPVAAEPTE